jgi:hypothetical protein
LTTPTHKKKRWFFDISHPKKMKEKKKHKKKSLTHHIWVPSYMEAQSLGSDKP